MFASADIDHSFITLFVEWQTLRGEKSNRGLRECDLLSEKRFATGRTTLQFSRPVINQSCPGGNRRSLNSETSNSQAEAMLQVAQSPVSVA
jgi:hypothetical protein